MGKMSARPPCSASFDLTDLQIAETLRVDVRGKVHDGPANYAIEREGTEARRERACAARYQSALPGSLRTAFSGVAC
jgi:hypothetical protein